MRPAHTTAAITVLVIDDDRIIRMVVREALGATGMRVIEAANAADGLQLAMEEQPDLVILDVMLPRVDGLALLAELRAATCDCPVLVFSATGSQNAVRARDLGAAGYIDKPFELHELQQRAVALVTHRGAA